MPSIRRPGGTIDTRRLGMAVSHPGIDPRVWVSLAVVTAVNVDPDHGPFVDVTLLPSGMNATARVGSELAGGGFGIWAPIRVDDEVIVIAPDGAPANGLVVTRRLWSQADKPADLMVSNPDDVLIQSRDGTNIRLKGTNSFIEADAPDILLHAEDGTTVELRQSDGSVTIKAKGAISANADGPISAFGGTTVTIDGKQGVNVHSAVGVTVAADGSISLSAPLVGIGGSTVTMSVPSGGQIAMNVPSGGQIVLGSGAIDPLVMASHGAGVGFMTDLYQLISQVAGGFLILGAAPGTANIGSGAYNALTNVLAQFKANLSLHETQVVKGK